jgi:CO/xanthine dehydrogenase Mo-binding subunit
MGSFGSGLGRSSAAIDLDSRGIYHLHVGVTDIGTGAQTTMALIAAEELGVPLSQIDLIWGDTARGPYSVGGIPAAARLTSRATPSSRPRGM